MPFHLTDALWNLCADMTARLEELAHIEMDRVAVGYRQTRRAVSHGLQASLTPMRFEGGALEGKVRGRKYTAPRLIDRRGRDCLYLLNVYVPRFLDQPFEEKLVTVVHELWHIGPEMDGDLRRHEGRCYAHGHSQVEYDRHAADLARQWLAMDPPEGLWGFLELGFAELAAEHRGVVGDRYPVPKLVPSRLAG